MVGKESVFRQYCRDAIVTRPADDTIIVVAEVTVVVGIDERVLSSSSGVDA